LRRPVDLGVSHLDLTRQPLTTSRELPPVASDAVEVSRRAALANRRKTLLLQGFHGLLWHTTTQQCRSQQMWHGNRAHPSHTSIPHASMHDACQKWLLGNESWRWPRRWCISAPLDPDMGQKSTTCFFVAANCLVSVARFPDATLLRQSPETRRGPVHGSLCADPLGRPC